MLIFGWGCSTPLTCMRNKTHLKYRDLKSPSDHDFKQKTKVYVEHFGELQKVYVEHFGELE